MKTSLCKFYIGVHLAGVVRTMIQGNESWFVEGEVVPNTGILVTTDYLTSKDEQLKQKVLIPFANVQWAIIEDEPQAEKTVPKKAVKSAI